VRALRKVDLRFRESEFVSVLGPSGCGKTTLLNIIGGLDRATSGDLIINGKSTKDFRDWDWDAYRNNSVGFVFQTYNLIPHQSVISNVELALTLSGVSKSERVAKAKHVLERVGLADQLYKKPNQLSGGQMQRVAIARALVNDPDILLADEPTGALDSETSVQIMELLHEIAAEKLVIMVTHNPELADKYSTRIIRLLDGEVRDDSNPPDLAEDAADTTKMKRTSMSFLTALTLSFTNLLTKKTRTILTAFAGSIGIIGIALILSLSNGLQAYISSVERDTLSSYPITIEHETVDLNGLLSTFAGNAAGEAEERPLDRVYVANYMARIMNTMIAQVKTNDLENFKRYLESNSAEIGEYTTAIEYVYDVPLNLYADNADTGLFQVNPSQLFSNFSAGGSSGGSGFSASMMQGGDMWRQLIPNDEYVATQYEVLEGAMPAAFDEAVLVVSERNTIPDVLLYSLGLRGQADLDAITEAMLGNGTLDETRVEYTYDQLLGLEYLILPPTEYYEKTGDGWTDQSGNAAYLAAAAAKAQRVKIVGILRPSEDAAATAGSDFIGYTSALTEYIVGVINDSEIVKAQLADPERDVLTGNTFEAPPTLETMDDVIAYINTLPEARRIEAAEGLEQMNGMNLGEPQIIAYINATLAQTATTATYDGNLALFGVTDLDRPSSINIYANSFENKDSVTDFITRYNETQPEGAELTYTDYIGLLLSSVSTVINAISYVLIAFVSISLVVSSIMIGIITYISVLERTREIGVLRSIGASKTDISRVFNAETLLVGFIAGALGIGVTVLLCIPANAIIKALTDIPNVAALPVSGGIALILISMFLTFIAGLIPSNMAARKDPVVALRTE
jgi:putative ABC transport system permease protein